MISFNAQLHLKTHHQLSDASLEETTRDITIGVIRHEKGPYAHSIIGWYPVGAGFQKAKFKVALEKLPLQCHYGDRITGRFSIGPIYRWKSRYFDAPNQFLRREHIYLEGRFKGDSLTIRPAPGFNLLHHSQRIAHHLQLTILQSISDVEIAQLLTSLLIGIKTNLDQEIKQSFIRSGTAHILAVSGLHLGMIYVLITTLINWIPIRLIRSSRPARCIIILVLIWAFALLTGMGASVIRAAVMLSLGLLGSLFKRRSDAVNTLFACAFLMLCNNPCRMFDIGFQLSFFAVLSILMFQPFVSRIWTPTTPVLIKLRDLLAISLSVQILITPVSLYYFHQFPTAFLLANLIWIPLSFVLMILTILIATVYMIFGEPIGLLSDLTSCLTKTGLRILNELNTLPNATLENLWISNSQLIGSTLCFVLLYFWLRKAAKYILQTILCIWLITGLLYPLRLKQIQTSRECILFHEKGRLQAAIRNGRKIHTTLPDSRALRTYRIAHFIQFEEPANMNEIRSFLSDNPPNEAKDSPYRNPEDDKRPFMEPENNNTDLVQRGISNTLMKYPAYPFLAKKDFLQKGPAIIALSNHD